MSRRLATGLAISFFIIPFAVSGYTQDNPRFIQGKKAFVNGDGKTAMALLLPLADSGNPNAQYMVAMMYEMGKDMYKGIKSNPKNQCLKYKG